MDMPVNEQVWGCVLKPPGNLDLGTTLAHDGIFCSAEFRRGHTGVCANIEANWNRGDDDAPLKRLCCNYSIASQGLAAGAQAGNVYEPWLDRRDILSHRMFRDLVQY